jgi:rhodanese-related sulfurtransferase
MTIVLELSPENLKDALGHEKNWVMIDVREDGERALASFPNAVAIPLAQLGKKINDYDKETPLVMICHHGYRSLQAALYAYNQGFREVYNLKGGIDAWSVAVDPTVPRY